MIHVNRRSERGITIIEVLCVVAILAALTAILVPVLTRAKHRAKVAVSVSNLRQAYLAMVIYADNQPGSAEAGHAFEMGLPDDVQVVSSGVSMFKASQDVWSSPCGQHPEAPFGATNIAYLPDNTGWWRDYTQRYLSSAVWLIDWNCTSHTESLNADFTDKLGIAVKGDGSVKSRKHYGLTTDIDNWWHR